MILKKSLAVAMQGIPSLLFGLIRTWIFLDKFWKNTQIQNFVKICQVRSELFRDGQTRQI